MLSNVKILNYFKNKRQKRKKLIVLLWYVRPNPRQAKKKSSYKVYSSDSGQKLRNKWEIGKLKVNSLHKDHPTALAISKSASVGVNKNKLSDQKRNGGDRNVRDEGLEINSTTETRRKTDRLRPK